MALYYGKKQISGGRDYKTEHQMEDYSVSFVDDGEGYTDAAAALSEINSGSKFGKLFAAIKGCLMKFLSSISSLSSDLTALQNKATELQEKTTTLENGLTSCISGIISITDKIYPVGSIYMSVNNTNPSTLFGGTWVSWGSGKVPIGINESDTDFSTVEKTGGAKTINIAHSHTVNSHSHTYGIVLSGYYGGTGFEKDNATGVLANGTGSPSGWINNGSSENIINTGLSQSNTTISTIHYKSTASTSSSSPSTNSQLSSTQSILQPYITCYMWKRTA